MTTNEQRDTAAILQMRKDLDEARELVRLADVFSGGFAALAKLHLPSKDMSYVEQYRERFSRFLARTEPKHGETK